VRVFVGSMIGYGLMQRSGVMERFFFVMVRGNEGQPLHAMFHKNPAATQHQVRHQGNNDSNNGIVNMGIMYQRRALI
jgi:hypothetical protein